jgi:hypothetical protein
MKSKNPVLAGLEPIDRSDHPRYSRLRDPLRCGLIDRRHRLCGQSGNLLAGLWHQGPSLNPSSRKYQGNGLHTRLPPGWGLVWFSPSDGRSSVKAPPWSFLWVRDVVCYSCQLNHLAAQFVVVVLPHIVETLNLRLNVLVVRNVNPVCYVQRF